MSIAKGFIMAPERTSVILPMLDAGSVKFIDPDDPSQRRMTANAYDGYGLSVEIRGRFVRTWRIVRRTGSAATQHIVATGADAFTDTEFCCLMRGGLYQEHLHGDPYYADHRHVNGACGARFELQVVDYASDATSRPLAFFCCAMNLPGCDLSSWERPLLGDALALS